MRHYLTAFIILAIVPFIVSFDPETLTYLDSVLLEPIRIPLISGHYISLLVGNPGTILNFRINRTSNDIEFHRSMQLESQTWDGSYDSNIGTEVIYIGKYAIRFPVIKSSYQVTYPLNLYDTSQYDGTIGLGEFSPLWKFWRSVSISTQELLLGAFDPYLQLDYDYIPPVFQFTSSIYKNETKYEAYYSFISNTVYAEHVLSDSLSENEWILESEFLRLDFDRFNTFVPNEMAIAKGPRFINLTSNLDCHEGYKKLGKDVKDCPSDIKMYVEMAHITLKNGKVYDCTSKLAHDESSISLGSHFIRSYTQYLSWDDEVFTLSHSPFGISNGRNFNALLALVIALIVITWLLIMYNSNFNSLRLFAVTMAMEVSFYLIALIIFLVNLLAYQWYKYASYFVKVPAWIVLTYVAYNLSSSLVGITILLSTQYRKSVKENRLAYAGIYKDRLMNFKNFRISLFINCALSILWFSVLPYQLSVFDALYITLFNVILCVLSTVITIHVMLWNRHYKLFIFFQTILHYIFLIFFNIIPTIGLYFLSHGSGKSYIEKLIMAIYIASIIVLVPSLMLATSIEKGIHKSSEYERLVRDYRSKSKLQ